MSNFFEKFFMKDVFLKTSIIVGVINIIFYLLTYDNHFFSDDYQHLIGLKLYNLIQGKILSLDNLLNLYTNHFAPFYLFYHQFMPDNFIYYHGIIAIIFFLSSLVVFQIVLKLTSCNKISFLSTLLYSTNMSIHIKPYVYNIFDFSIVNSFTGFLSIFFFILFFQTHSSKKYLWLIAYLIFSIISCLNFENGLIYPILTTLIAFLFLKKQYSLKSFLGLVPLLVFFILLISNGNNLSYLAKERLNESYNERFAKNIDLNKNTYAYFYRSQYAYRDLTGYSFRIFDNIISSVNLYSLENSLKYYINPEKFKNYVLSNYQKLAIILFIVFFILIVIFFKNLNKIRISFPVAKFLLIYLATFLIYTFIFFRQDLNSALAFSSSILISIFVIEFYRNKFFLIPTLVLFFFLGSTILYSSTGFEHVKYSGTRSFIKNVSQIHYENAHDNIIDEKIIFIENYKFLYYYLNYDENKDYLKKFKDLKYTEFVSAMIGD